MTEVRFYRQLRYDGGVRTGLGINDQPVLHEFRAGKDESDPAILWYADIALEGKGLPDDADDARQWLIDHADAIVKVLRTAAERLEIGLDDSSDWPYRVSISGLPRGTRGEIRVSSVRGLAEGELADRLSELADDWVQSIERLAPMASV
jgi:hypothetical protein